MTDTEDSQPVPSRLERRLDRERRARLEAETVAERGTRELYERQQELLLHKAVASAANEALTIEEALQITLDQVCAYTGWPVGDAYLLDKAAGDLAPSGLWHLDHPDRYQAFREITEATRFPPGIGLPGRVLSSAKPAWIMDVNKDDNFPRAKHARDIGVKAGFGFPILVGREVVGVLEFFAPEALGPNERLLDTMADIGTQLGRVIERKRAEDRITYLAYHDALTGLPNRALFQDRLAVTLAQAHRNDGAFAVVSLDLDRFKLINDTSGHMAGDRALKDTADRLVGILREGDTIARLGGDEFMLLLPGVARAEDAAQIGESILGAFRAPHDVDGGQFYTTTSLGISLYPHDGTDAKTLVNNADAAMYRAKEMGRDNYQLYTPSMNVKALERLTLEGDMRHALEQHEFVVYYQPQVTVSGHQIVGVEALVRWQHPERGLMPPNDFIPLAEETGLIVPLGEWVLRTSCQQVEAWQGSEIPGLRLAVNISMRQFQQADFLGMITKVLTQTGLDARSLELEITESIAMRDPEATIGLLRQLRQMGIRISLDDFGTGFSSLKYLKDLPIHTLKIDQSFVHDLESDTANAEIVLNIIRLGHSLNLNVIAEGVETNQQLSYLLERDCDEFQGYFCARPMDANALEVMLRRASTTLRKSA